jgi:hypothetical protein
VTALRLRDQSWQAIGTIIGVIALLVSTIVAYDVLFKSNPIASLTVEEWYSWRLLPAVSENMEDRIVVLLDGKEATSLRIHYYRLLNSGRAPILAEDFVKPIQVSVEGPWEILAVDTEWSSPTDIEARWSEIVTNTFEVEPMLLNPDDKLIVAIFLSNPKGDTDGAELPELDWSTRVINLPRLTTRHVDENDSRTLFGLDVVIHHVGWGVVLWAGLAGLLVLVGMILAMSNRRLVRFSVIEVLLVLTIMAFSWTTSEMIVDFLVNRNRSQWWGAWLLVPLYVLLLVYLAWPFIWRRLRRSKTASEGTTSRSSVARSSSSSDNEEVQ